MKKFLKLMILVLAVGIGGMTKNADALSLQWDAVTTDPTGVALGSGMQVSSYKVWKCNSPSTSCLKATATVIGTVSVATFTPTYSLSITTQPVPSTYFVTAVNIVTESVESDSLKATGSDKPKNLIFVQP